jgi:hypothetical protein
MFAKARRAHFVFEQWENLPELDGGNEVLDELLLLLASLI